MDTLTAFLTLLFVMDPLGNIPVFLAALKTVPQRRQLYVIMRELIFALIVLLAFLYGGRFVLAWLGLSQEAIRIAGAIILFLISIRMVFPSEGGIMGERLEGEPFFVPLAVPLVAGPSTMAILMLMTNSGGEQLMDWTLALLGAWAVSAVILLSSAPLARLLGNRGLIAVERLMGMVLVMLSVQLFLDGVKQSLG
ncbi:MarC family protein [Microbulbifer litoralis]|uniref:MarC family protein n=1 Tax=Microbulbifer litoralis TaxID=2933965 RepID=UPI00202893E3|nr:MarC family protein [Microbulbifer sp. GX H0434]